MDTDSDNEASPAGVPQTSATPSPSAAGDSRPTPSNPIEIVRTGRLAMSVPSGRHMLPASYIDQYRNVTVGSPSTPPEYYVPRATTRRAPANRVALAAAAALESNRDRQPLLMTDAYTVPLQDGTVSPMQYCIIGLLFAGLCVAAALVVVDAPGGKRTTPLRLNEELRHPGRRSPMPSYDPPELVNANAVVVIPDRQHAPVDLGVNVSGLGSETVSGAKPENSVDTTVAAKIDAAPLATEVGSMAVEGSVRPDSCNRYYYTHCTKPTANVFHYDPDQMACVPNTRRGVQLCNRGANRFSSWERCRANCLQPDRVAELCFQNALFMPCSKQDFVDALWYFNGTSCTRWTFYNGHCPSGECGVYETFDQCSRHCVKHNSTSTSAQCEVPPSGEWSLALLRYPFFADMQAQGEARCLNASSATLFGRLCLAGSNQFDSIEACQNACLEGPVSPSHHQ
ncbi:hypothetical protein HPB52_000424 [Rhipicephalus sanguineus]|uniref:Uncharacterized protein n=1 Tax=Rhipicephalus sanguineus TaxID=34632 RepID=A0A9D4T6A6_RHISA|nr:hypothetical protein HPB52_000424 [Rhipicephalus sanguineus]